MCMMLCTKNSQPKMRSLLTSYVNKSVICRSFIRRNSTTKLYRFYNRQTNTVKQTRTHKTDKLFNDYYDKNIDQKK